MSQSNKLSVVGVKVDAVRKRNNLSWYQVAKNANNMDYAQLHRTMRQLNHTRKTLNRICDAINCTPDERKEIFHAAGFLLSEEIEEERPVCAA